MQIAEKKSGTRISTEQAEKGVLYLCPVCHQDVFLKKGDIKVAHFAHKHKCTETWQSDMSIWHSNWQNRFPIEMREVVKEIDGQRHRADILIEDKKVVVEFQHSPLPKAEFNERTLFYNSIGFKVIWVFDVCDAVDNNAIYGTYRTEIDHYYIWNHPKQILRDLDGLDMELFLQLKKRKQDNDLFIEREKKLSKGKAFYKYEANYKYDQEYLLKHNNDGCELIRVKYWLDADFPSCFHSYSNFEESSFVDFALDYSEIDGPPKKKILPTQVMESPFSSEDDQQAKGKTVFDFWDDNTQYIILKNTQNDFYFKFIENPRTQYIKNSSCRAYMSKDPYSFPYGTREVFYTSKKTWILQYKKNKTPKS